MHRAEILKVLRITLIVLAVFGFLWLVYELRTIILLVIFSILFAYLVAPLVAFVRRRVRTRGERELPPAIAIGIVYLILFGGLAVVFASLLPSLTEQVAQFAKEAPQRIQSAEASGRSLSGFYARLKLPGLPPSMVERGLSTATSAIDAGLRQVVSALVRMAGYLPWLVLIPILSFFLVKDAATLRQGALRLFPQHFRSQGDELFERIDRMLAAYIRAQLVACVLVGVAVGVGFTLLRVPYAGILAIAAGLAEFVPLVGPFVIAIASGVIASLQSLMLAFWVLVFLGVLRLAEDYVIYPRLVGRNIHLHPLAIILAVLAGAELGGVVGVLLSVPALAIFVAVYRFVDRNVD